MQRLSGFRQLLVPRRQGAPVGPALEKGVALFQGSPIATPRRQKAPFHVKQAPVQIPPPLLRRTGDQLMAARLERHDREASAELREAGDVGTVHAGFPGLAGVAKAGASRPPRPIRPLGEQLQLR